MYINSQTTLQQAFEDLIEALNRRGQDDPVGDNTFREKMDALTDKVMSRDSALLGIEMNLSQIAKALTKVIEGDEQALTERLKLKIKANYSSRQSVLQEFVEWAKNKPPDYLDDTSDIVNVFLEEVGGATDGGEA